MDLTEEVLRKIRSQVRGSEEERVRQLNEELLFRPWTFCGENRHISLPSEDSVLSFIENVTKNGSVLHVYALRLGQLPRRYILFHAHNGECYAASGYDRYATFAYFVPGERVILQLETRDEIPR